MSFQPTPTDVSVIISTPSSGPATDSGPSIATERRVTPTWTVSQLKGKLETMTGIPPGNQKLLLKTPGKQNQWVEGDERLIGEWGLTRGCEIEVCYCLIAHQHFPCLLPSSVVLIFIAVASSCR